MTSNLASSPAFGTLVSGDRQLTPAALGDRVARAARALAGLGIVEGAAVALLLRNDVALFEASLAAQDLGAYAVPVNWHFTADEVGYILRDCGARVLVVHADLLPGVRAGLPPGIAVLAVPTPPEIAAAYRLDPARCAVPADAADWNAAVAAAAPWDRPPAAQRASMIYTSGTTGRPKGVRRRPMDPGAAGVYAGMRRHAWGMAPGVEIRTVMTGPMYHSAPNSYGLYAARSGALVVLQPRFEAEELLALIERHRITHLHMVPTMFVRLLRLPDAVRRRHDLSSLRWVVHGAAPCPPAAKRAMIEWWGPVIHEYYGSTEASIVAAHDSAEALARPGTVGRPIPGAELRIYDDAGNVLPPGQVGEIYVWLHGYSDFTYQNRDDDRRAIARDGLVTNGDVGYLDADGYLYLCDRKRDMVIAGGVNIYPAEIESVLVQMPGVHDCAVFGIPDPEFGEALCAAVEPLPGAKLTPAAVRAYLKGRIADYKIPKTVEFRADLPREDTGKIFKRLLREPYWAEAGRKI